MDEEHGDFVLIVEDDEDIRTNLAGILEDEGYSVVTASNGLEALHCLSEPKSPCVILLDLMMPQMDGWELRRELLKDSRLASVPVIILSGTGNVGREAKALGAVSWVSKPFHLPQLLGALGQYC